MQGKVKSGNNSIFATKDSDHSIVFLRRVFEMNFSGRRSGWEPGAPFRFSPLPIFNH